MRHIPYTEDEIDKMIDCLVDNDLLDSNADDDLLAFQSGLDEYISKFLEKSENIDHPKEWTNIRDKLITLGGLESKDLIITAHGYGGSYGDNDFYTTWIGEGILLVTMEKWDKSIIDAFSKVMGYKPFCRYLSLDGITVEWNKINVILRKEEIETTPEFTNIEWLD